MALQQIDPDKPQVYNGIQVSYGIAPILNALSVLSRQPNRKKWTLYLINAETLIRDRKSKDTTIEQTALNVITDCTVMAQYIAAYNRTIDFTNQHQSVICFYLSKYENIRQPYLRKILPKGTDERWEIRDEVEKLITNEGFANSYDDTQVTFCVAGDTKAWPHKELVTDLNKKFDGIVYRSVLMVSHVPLDFHLYRTFKDFTLLESYTGNFKTVKDFGKKVFGDPEVPFNKYTHLLLGDKWYLEALADKKTKSLIKKRAKDHHWNLLPDKNVLKEIVDMHLQISTDLIIRPDI